MIAKVSGVALVAGLISAGYQIRDLGLLERADFLAHAYLSSHSSDLKRKQSASLGGPKLIPIQAATLFDGSGKGPRADHYRHIADHGTARGPMIMAASITALDGESDEPLATASVVRETVYRVNRSIKGALPSSPGEAAEAEKVLKAGGAGSLLSDTANIGVFSVSSAVVRNFVEEERDRSEAVRGAGEMGSDKPSAVAASGSDWKDLIKMARISPEDATIFGGLSEAEFRKRELFCMATAIYFESRAEPIRGQIAVGQVIMNRVRSPYYPKTICGVIYQGMHNRNACQFSYACDGIPDRINDEKSWKTSVDVAKQVITGKPWIEEVGSATHYHATYVNPKWKTMVKRVAKIGVHIFYKAPFADPQVAYNNLPSETF